MIPINLSKRCHRRVVLSSKYDIKVAIHNHAKDISPKYWNPKGVLKACKGRSQYIGACGDVGYWIRSGIDPVEAIEQLGDRLMTLQVHDLNENNKDGHDVPWGTGKTDLKAFFQKLKDLGVDEIKIN